MISSAIGNWLLQVSPARLVRIDVDKSAYHQLSHFEIGTDNPVLDIYLRNLVSQQPRLVLITPVNDTWPSAV
jgi:hypothetical protein